MLRAFLVAAGLIAMAACQPADNSAPAPKAQEEAQAAAASGLQALQTMATEQRLFAELGFASAEEARSAQLGKALPVFVVGLEPLRSYVAGADVNALLKPSADSVYPVLVGEAVKSSVTIEKVESGFRPAQFGAPQTARAIAAAAAAAIRTPPAPGPVEPFLVRVPALGLDLVATRAGDQMLLTPTRDVAETELRAGATLPAADVFVRLIPVAQAVNADAPM